MYPGLIRPIHLVAAILFLLFSSFSENDHFSAFEKVKVDGGFISGTINDSKDIHIFKGIPFAAPPINELRWKAPQPVISWSGTKSCTAFGPSPMQGTPLPFSMWTEEFLIPKSPISEDCLTLNIWTGASTPNEKRSVLVWIHGGGFISGGAACPIYDGEAMAKKGIIFVSINYRVGIFGFFAHPELTKESPVNASGNYGLLDQVAALKWIQRNIASFGGDPSNVTIAGESAGAFSVNALVASPLCKGLFQKAIAESGGVFPDLIPDLSSAEESGIKLMQTMNLSSLAALRNAKPEDLMKVGQNGPKIIADGYFLQEQVTDIFNNGKENKVSLITGWNEDEGILLGMVKNAPDFTKEVTAKYRSEEVLRYYPASNDEEAAASQLKLSRDEIFGVKNYAWANVQSQHGANVYMYRFMRKPPRTGEYARYGAFHGGEIPYAYDNLKFFNCPFQPVDHEIAKLMSGYWTNFIKTGNPNGNGQPEWKPFSTGNKVMMAFAEQTFTRPMKDTAGLNFIYGMMTVQ